MSPPKPSQAHDHTPAPPAQPHTPTLSHDSPHHGVKRNESWIMKSQTYETSKPIIKAKPDFLKKGNKGQSSPVPAKFSSLKETSDLVEDSERFVQVEISCSLISYMYIVQFVIMCHVRSSCTCTLYTCTCTCTCSTSSWRACVCVCNKQINPKNLCVL